MNKMGIDSFGSNVSSLYHSDGNHASPTPEERTLEVTSMQAKGEKKYAKEEIIKEINHLNKWLQNSSNTHLKFNFHEKLGEYYVQVINDETSEVIREIPSKKIMDIAASINEMIGLLVDEKL
jgi:flagellar protein FlaG